jgi:hypothetical protein
LTQFGLASTFYMQQYLLALMLAFKKYTAPGNTAYQLAKSRSLLLLLPLIGVGAATPPPSDVIILRSAPQPFTPTEFYIAGITDERKDKSAVAWLLHDANTPAVQAMDLKGGALPAIQHYIKESLPANTRLRPVTIRLQECRVTEQAAEKGRIEGRVEVTMAFDYKRNGETVHLAEYKGGARYKRSASQVNGVEPALRQSLSAGLQYINTWINQNAPHNELLARGIQVTFTDYTLNQPGDTVFYTPDRPLTWSDFKAPPRPGRFAATVFPSFAYDGNSMLKNGIIHINLTMKVYVLKESSWVKDNARNTHGLNHEQRHFEIVKLVTERFKQKVQPQHLTIEDYNSIIQHEYIESFREMNRLQEQYDTETQHGLNYAIQEQWNQRIDKELASFGIKK